MALPVIQDSDITRSIKHCLTCAKVCFETLTHCLEMGMSGKHISHMQLCADTCQLAARMMMADSDLHQQSCELCFEMCMACAEMCDRYDEPEMHRCAEVCRNCAESCRHSAGMTVRVNMRQESERAQQYRY